MDDRILGTSIVEKKMVVSEFTSPFWMSVQCKIDGNRTKGSRHLVLKVEFLLSLVLETPVLDSYPLSGVSHKKKKRISNPRPYTTGYPTNQVTINEISDIPFSFKIPSYYLIL